MGLFKAVKRDCPRLMKQLGEIQRFGVSTSTGDCQKILSHGVNQIIHVTPPINVANTFFKLMALNPSPVYVDREGSNSVVNLLKIVKTRLGIREACGLEGFTKG